MSKSSRATADKRKAERFNVPIQVKYKYLPHKKVLAEAIVQNISGSGIRLKLPHPLHKGKHLKVLLYFPGDRHFITALSEVVWCRKILSGNNACYDLGVRYLKIQSKDRERFVFRFCEMMINILTLGKTE